MKFFVLCVVAFFAPNLLDDGDPRAPVPQFEDRQALPAEEAPIAGPAEPGDPDQRRILKRRPRRPEREPARFLRFLQERREAWKERRSSNAPRRRGRLGDRHQVDEAPPAPIEPAFKFCPPPGSQPRTDLQPPARLDR